MLLCLARRPPRCTRFPCTTPFPSSARATWFSSGSDRYGGGNPRARSPSRSQEHTSDLQSPCNIVCRLLLEKTKKKHKSLKIKWKKKNTQTNFTRQKSP